jgi:hypothetical protein
VKKKEEEQVDCIASSERIVMPDTMACTIAVIHASCDATFSLQHPTSKQCSLFDDMVPALQPRPYAASRKGLLVPEQENF